MRRICGFTLAAVSIIVPSLVFAHPGKLDSRGCHTNRKTGEYHCHGGSGGSAPPQTGPGTPATPPHQSFHSRPQNYRQSDTKSYNYTPPVTVGQNARQTQAAKQPAQKPSVLDGDTFKAVVNGEEISIRLHGIDAPEENQPMAERATMALNSMIAGRKLEIIPLDRDKYGRVVALVYADGHLVNQSMVASGYAWVFPKYCTQDFCNDWNASEIKARVAKKGIWETEQIAPWDWRASKK